MPELLKEIETIPVVDCHEHQVAASDSVDPRYPGMNYGFPDEPIAFVLRGYFPDDLMSAGATDEDISFLKDISVLVYGGNHVTPPTHKRSDKSHPSSPNPKRSTWKPSNFALSPP
jgi:hypothetical protein